MPRVSVVMATKDAEVVVSDAIRSVQASTEPDWEILAVDDHSTDATLSQLASLEAADARIRVLQLGKGEHGPGAARNLALANARGAAIAILDADDRMRPRRLERQLDHLARSTAWVVGGHAVTFGCGNPTTIAPPCDRDEVARWLECARMPFVHPSLIFQRRYFDRFGFYRQDLPRAQDFELLLRGQSKVPLENIPEVVIDYRVRCNNRWRRWIRNQYWASQAWGLHMGIGDSSEPNDADGRRLVRYLYTRAIGTRILR